MKYLFLHNFSFCILLIFSFLPSILEKVVRIKKTFSKILWISQQGNVLCIYLLKIELETCFAIDVIYNSKFRAMVIKL